MLRTLSLRSPWAMLGLGAGLLLLPVWALSQPPAATGQQGPLEERAAVLQAKLKELQTVEKRLDMELEHVRSAIRLLERTLKQAQEAPLPAATPVAATEQRLQQVEQTVLLLHKELVALRQQLLAKAPQRFTTIDLQSKINHKSKDDFHSGRYPGNNLTSLPTGDQTLLGIKLHIGDGVVQLGSTSIQDKPEKIAGIQVGKRCAKLHILHATGYYLEEERRIGAYTINYEDGTSATIPIVYFQDVLDWWKYPGLPEPTRGKVAWEGTNEAAKGFDATIRLYLTTWENPNPDKRVASIDYSSSMETICAPFCVAMTVEEVAGGQ